MSISIVCFVATVLGIIAFLLIEFLASFVFDNLNIIETSRCLLKLIYVFAVSAAFSFIVSQYWS